MPQILMMTEILFSNELSANICAKWSVNNLIMAGDFNVFSEKNDKKSKTVISAQRSADILKQLMPEYNLIDIWRGIHPQLKRIELSVMRD